MKKIMLFLAVFLFACHQVQTKEQQAQELVKSYLKTALNDPSSYEGISFDTLRISHQDYGLGDPYGRKLDTLAASFLDSSIRYRDLAEKEFDGELHGRRINVKKYARYQRIDTLFTKKSDSVEAIEKIRGKDYKGRVVGYGINHIYRAKNGFGALIVYRTDFWIDSNLTKIINVQDSK